MLKCLEFKTIDKSEGVKKMIKQTMVYTGIVSRDIPDDIKRYFIVLSRYFAKLGFVLRSGAAKGADEAFELGCDMVQGKKEIYIPWRGSQF